MKRTGQMVLWLLIVSAAAVGAEPAQKPDKSVMMMFQDAQYQEQTAGNLDKAIELYQQVIKDAAEIERLAARATFQLGMCYLKKGDKDKAAEYFQKVVSDYPSQKELVTNAKKQFEKLKPASSQSSGDYVIHYKAVDQSQEGLTLLNKIMPKGVRTFRASKYRADGQTIDSIRTDTEEGKDKLVEAINNSAELKLVKVELPHQSSGDYVIHYKAVDQSQNALELLNKIHPKDVSTFRYKEYQANGEQLASICTNTEESKDKLVETINGSDTLKLVKVESPQQKDSNILIAEELPIDKLNLSDGVTLETIKSLLGQPEEEKEKWVGYKKRYSIDFYIDENHAELRLNPGFKGHLANGISLESTTDDLFGIYGQPRRTENTNNLMDKFETNVLYRMGEAGKISLEKENLLFWLEGNKITQIVLYKGTIEGSKRTAANAAESSPKQIVLKDSFEQGNDVPDGWEKGANIEGVKYIWDKNAASDGKASLCLKKTAQKYFPIAQWTRNIEYTGEAKKVELSAKVRASKAYKAVLDVLFLDEQDKWIKHEWAAYIGAREENDPPANHNWKEYRGAVEIPENTKTIVIGLQMYGPGMVWFDELEVAYLNEHDKASTKPDKLRSEDLTAEGWKLWQERKLTEAEKKFKEAVAADPTSDGAYQGLGWAQLNQGKKNNAKASFEKCVELNPNNSAALNGLGWIAHGQDDKDQAIVWWEKAVKAQPGATASLSGLTQVYMEREDYVMAVKYYKMWLKAEPNNQEAKDGLEKAKQGNLSTSVADIGRLIKELDDPKAPRFVAMNRLIELGKPSVALLIEAMKTSNNWQIPKALGAIGDQTAIGALIEKWKETNTSPMKEVIAESLGLITGQTFGEDLQKWQQWWKENEPKK